jgi:hypothetical protein
MRALPEVEPRAIRISDRKKTAGGLRLRYRLRFLGPAPRLLYPTLTRRSQRRLPGSAVSGERLRADYRR